MIFNFALYINGSQVKPLNYPSVNINPLFNSIDFELSTTDMFTNSIKDNIKNDGYVSCQYNINGDMTNFIIDSFDYSIEFGNEAVKFSGLSKTALIEERFAGLSDISGVYSSSELLSIINARFSEINIINNLNVSVNIETENKSYIDIIKDIKDVSGFTAVTSFDGLSLYFIGGLYNSSDVDTIAYTIDNVSELISLSTSFETDTDYNAIDIISELSSDDIGEIIIETEKITDDSYFLYVYTNPLYANLQLSSSDGVISLYKSKEIVSNEVLVDFSEDSATLQYPIHSIVKVDFYNNSNSLDYTTGERDITLANSDDLAVAKVIYRTVRNVYTIRGLTEPIVKIKFEVL